jgi:ATP-dependent Clp protease ATP-binding subunit ClpA
MTSNLGAAEMSSILRPKLGFTTGEENQNNGQFDKSATDKISRASVEAARRRFAPEFMNRIDKVVVFKPLADIELREVLTLELDILQQRIMHSSTAAPFVFSLTEAAKEFLLREGTDAKYGARHLKRAIDRALVHPMSNLIATQQVRGGDLIKVDFDPDSNTLTFAKEAEDMPAYAVVQMTGLTVNEPKTAAVAGAVTEIPRVAARGRRTLAG